MKLFKTYTGSYGEHDLVMAETQQEAKSLINELYGIETGEYPIEETSISDLSNLVVSNVDGENDKKVIDIIKDLEKNGDFPVIVYSYE